MDISIKYFDENVPRIEKFEQGDWIDLRICDAVINNSRPVDWSESTPILLQRWDEVKFSLGIGMKLPKDCEAHIVPRSSTFRKFGLILVNSMGIIDESYCGDEDQWFAVTLVLREHIHIFKYERLFQFRIITKMPPINFITTDKLNDKSRGGYGSTDKKYL